MPDGVTIGITSTYSGAGVQQAIADLGGLDKFAKQSTVNMAKVDATVAQAKATLASAAAPALTFGQKLQFAGEVASGLVNHIGNVITKTSLVAAGMGYAAKQVYEFGKQGATIQYTTEKFDRLARTVGTTGDVFMRQLQTATRGTVSTFDLAKQGADLFQLGLAKTSQEAVRLSGVMTALGMDTGELTLALANQSKRRLDQLGLSLSKFNEIEARLKDSGMNKQDAFKEAFLQTAEQTVMQTGNRADSALAPYLQMQASGSNVWNNLKQSTSSAIAPDVQNFANFLKAWNAVQSGEMAWGGNLGQIMTGATPALISGQQNLANLAQQQWIKNNTTYDTSRRGGAGVVAPSVVSSAQSFLYEDAAVRRANAATAAQTSAIAQELDYAGMLAGGQDLTEMQTKFAKATEELNDKLTEEVANLDEMTKKYGEGSDKVVEQQQKIADLQSGFSELDNAMQKSTDQWVLGMMKNKGATEEMQYEYAYAAGLISEDAMEAYEANNKLFEAYQDGVIKAKDYAAATSDLSGWVKSMNGMQVNSYIDVWIRIHGDTSLVKRNGSSNNPNGGGEQRKIERMDENGAPTSYNWTGGPLTDGGFTVVGDAPGGAWTPYTEVVYNGQVFNAEASRALRDAGLLDGASYLAGGSAGERPGSRPGAGILKRTDNSSVVRNVRRPSSDSGYSAATVTSTSEEIAVTAADVAEQAAQVSQQSAAQNQTVANNVKQSTAQTVEAQQQSQVAIVDKLDEVVTALKKQPTTNDMYALYRSGQQMNI